MGKKTPVYDATGKMIMEVHSATTSLGVAKRAGWKAAQFAYRCPNTDVKFDRPGWVESATLSMKAASHV